MYVKQLFLESITAQNLCKKNFEKMNVDDFLL